jgi:hypothetical protein
VFLYKFVLVARRVRVLAHLSACLAVHSRASWYNVLRSAVLQCAPLAVPLAVVLVTAAAADRILKWSRAYQKSYTYVKNGVTFSFNF